MISNDEPKLGFALTNITSKKKRQRIFKINYYLPSSDQWSFLKRKEHLLGLPCYQLKTMGCVSLLLGMLSLFRMVGHYKICHHTVLVTIHSAMNMHWPVKQVVFKLYNIMRCVISQPLGSPRFVIEWQLSHISNHRAPLVDQIVNQDYHLGECHDIQQWTWGRLCSYKRNSKKKSQQIFKINYHLPSSAQWSFLKRKEAYLATNWCSWVAKICF